MPFPVTTLLLDDEPLLRRATALLLSNRGGRVTAASSADEAVALAERERYDVAIFDLSAPAPSAAEVLGRMRARGPLPRRVIAVSDGAVDEGAEAEFAAVLRKPYPFERLMRAVFGGGGVSMRRVACARSAARVSTRSGGHEGASPSQRDGGLRSAPARGVEREHGPRSASTRERGGRRVSRSGVAVCATSRVPRRAPRAARGRG